MNPTVPDREELGDSCVGGSAEKVAVENRNNTCTALHQVSSNNSPITTSSLITDASPTHKRQNAVFNTPKTFNTYSGVSCLAEYLREETHTGPLSLDAHLFPECLHGGDVVEIWGDANCGKSVLTLTLIASALLPAVWSGVELGGCNTGVTLVDCDQHFSIFQLVSLMYKKVKACLKLAKDTLSNYKKDKTIDMKPICNIQEVKELLRNSKVNLKIKIEELVHGCLKSLYYIKCMESAQFPIVLASMDEHLSKNSDVSLVVIDSLSSFTWHDWIYRGNGKFADLKKYYDRIYEVLLANIKRYKVVLVAVKQSLFLKSCEEILRKGQDEPGEGQETFQDDKMMHCDENDVDMEEGVRMDNMTESEYLGYTWCSSVTYQVVLSKVRVNSRTHPVVIPKDVVVVESGKTPQCATGESWEDKEALFLAEVNKNKETTKLFYVIGEEGVVWRHLADISKA